VPVGRRPHGSSGMPLASVRVERSRLRLAPTGRAPGRALATAGGLDEQLGQVGQLQHDPFQPLEPARSQPPVAASGSVTPHRNGSNGDPPQGLPTNRAPVGRLPEPTAKGPTNLQGRSSRGRAGGSIPESGDALRVAAPNPAADGRGVGAEKPCRGLRTTIRHRGRRRGPGGGQELGSIVKGGLDEDVRASGGSSFE
jgi:hypothetical protein